MTTRADGRATISLERVYPASVERVWRMFTTKDGLEKWWGPVGFTSKVTRLDVKVGGGFEIEMTAVDPAIIEYLKTAGVPQTSSDKGDYDDVQAHRRLSWVGAVDFVPGVAKYTSDTTVELSTSNGATRVVIRTTAMHDEHWTTMKKLGWEQQLEKLTKHFKEQP